MDEKTRQAILNATDIVDEDDYTWGDSGKIDIKKIIFMHLNRISETIFKGEQAPKYTENLKEQVITKSFDKRETLIEAVNFLMALLEPYYDKDMIGKSDKFLEELSKIKVKLFNMSLEKEAHSRADNDYKRFNIDSPKEYTKLVSNWKQYLKDNNFVFYDKDSPEYEYFIDLKYELMINIFYELNHLLHRQDYLETQAYTE
tara:strand:+ start:128 stop:730 length:603 start_codon:yes stop_codon:yes gene_type:complete